MKNELNYLKLREKLVSEIKEIPGVISVGLTNKNGMIALLIAVNSKELKSELPDKYEGIEIVLKDIGKAKKYNIGGKIEFKY